MNRLKIPAIPGLPACQNARRDLIGHLPALQSLAGMLKLLMSFSVCCPMISGAAMRAAVEAGEVSGAVTVVVTKDKILH